jgi:hypothetical protein
LRISINALRGKCPNFAFIRVASTPVGCLVSAAVANSGLAEQEIRAVLNTALVLTTGTICEG